MRSYNSCIQKISGDDLYKGFLSAGMFSEKLIPIFTSRSFFKYCEKEGSDNLKKIFSAKPKDYISVNIMRNNNVPRTIVIPTPMLYYRLCSKLREHWKKIKEHFQKYTSHQKYKVSRIHIRKYKNSNIIFKMSYNRHWETDGTPEVDLLGANRYVVKADISNCFPSIYTHAISWALVGKENAKKEKKSDSEWYNEIDKACRNVTNGETHGLPIGPHTSNLLSEIILTVIDDKMKKWHYIRNIDDYTCYVESYEEAEKFITELSRELSKFDLSINSRKTSIKEIYLTEDNWKYKISQFPFTIHYDKIKYPTIKAYIDLVIDLMKDNENNLAIINYSIKTIKKYKLTDNAREYFSKRMLHLAIIFPYLLPLMDKYIFKKCKVSVEDIKEFSTRVLKIAVEKNNYEAICYAIYYSLEYNFKLQHLDFEWIQETDDCLVKLFAWLYAKRYNKKNEIKKLMEHAKEIQDSNSEMNRNWLFVYECLPFENLKDEWKNLKKSGVSFLLPKYRN